MNAPARPANPDPVLQIIHVSDLHVLAAKHPAAPTIRRVQQILKRFGRQGQELLEKLKDGTAPSDPISPFVFPDFVKKITSADPIWAKYPTWLVDSGDHTTFGDDVSLAQARQHLISFISAMSPRTPNVSLVNLPGNHDAWPEDLPLFAGHKVQAQVAKLAGAPLGYALGRAQMALRAPLAAGQEIQLYTLDTVNTDSVENTLARGNVERPQRVDLATLMQSNQGTTGARHLRIVVTHHPVHFPPPRPWCTMVIANEQEVGLDLRTGAFPVQLVLSGHTHDLFPKHGALPSSVRKCAHDPLGANQCQLVIGTLMQMDLFKKRGDNPYQCQVLRFYQDPDTPHVVLLERLLASRNPNSTPGRIDYAFVPVPGKSSFEEEILLEV